MGLEERYEAEERAVIDDETLTENERSRLLRDLYREGQELFGEHN